MKELIANVYERQYQELLDKIGKKLFRDRNDFCLPFCTFMEMLKKNFDGKHIINLIIGNMKIIKNSRVFHNVPMLSYIVYYNDEEYKNIRLYDIDVFYQQLHKVYSLIDSLLFAKNMVMELWKRETRSIFLQHRLKFVRLTYNEYMSVKKEYEKLNETDIKFCNIPKYIEQATKEVEEYINKNNFFDNQNWEYLKIIKEQNNEK